MGRILAFISLIYMFNKLVTSQISIKHYFFVSAEKSIVCKLWGSLYFCNSNIELCYRFILKILKQK